jgi:hypothetical protein
MKTIVTVCLLVSTLPALAQMRSWRFTADGKIGGMSFRKGGSIRAEFVRWEYLDGTNVVWLQLETGSKGYVPASILSTNDAAFVSRFKGEPEAIANAREQIIQANTEAELAARQKAMSAMLRQRAQAAADAAQAKGKRIEAQQKQEEAQENNSIHSFLPLLAGRPAPGTSYETSWLDAVAILQKNAASSNPVIADAAKVALQEADEVTDAKNAANTALFAANAERLRRDLVSLVKAGAATY